MTLLKNIPREERLNVISHFIGIPLSVLGCYFLLSKVENYGVIELTSLWVYSLSLFSMFACSTFYHAVVENSLKRKLRIADHINIYYLIAGTYTPVVLITLINGNGWFIFYTVWGIAGLGTFLKLFFTGRYEFISLILYLFMGWLIVLDIDNLVMQVSTNGLNWLMVGGMFYTVGIIFYTIRKIPNNHFIWHLFVLGGAISHWFFIYFDVA